MAWEASGLPSPFLPGQECSELFSSVIELLMPHLSPFQWTRDLLKGRLVSSFHPCCFLFHLEPSILAGPFPPPGFREERVTFIAHLLCTLSVVSWNSHHNCSFLNNYWFSFPAVLGPRCCVGFPPATALRLLIAVTSLVAERGLWGACASVVAARGLNSCGSQALEQTQKLGCTGLVALRLVGSSRIRGQTCVSHLGGQICYH